MQRALPRRPASGPVRAWIDALFSPQALVSGANFQISGLVGQVKRWLEDLQQATTAGFRVSFQLQTPALVTAPGERSWTVHYLLQATDDPSLQVPAEQVWQEAGSDCSPEWPRPRGSFRLSNRPCGMPARAVRP
jgi:hypothetical protein